MSSADERARALRRRVIAAPGGSLACTGAEVIAELGGDDIADARGELRPDEVARAVLVHHGVHAEPPLARSGSSARVVLRSSPRYALQGAYAMTALATVIGLVGRPLYGLVLAAAGLCGVAAIASGHATRFAPQRIPRGRLLGVFVALIPIIVVGALVILPLRSHYSSHDGVVNATALVRQADAAINHGDFATAKRKLFEAEASAPNPPAADDVRAHLIVAVVQSQIDDAARKDGIYSAAERAFGAGHRSRAATLMRSISGWKDADARAQAFLRGRAN